VETTPKLIDPEGIIQTTKLGKRQQYLVVWNGEKQRSLFESNHNKTDFHGSFSLFRLVAQEVQHGGKR
jgi:hypothetical protein